MVRILLLCLFFNFISPAFSQEQGVKKVLFSEALSAHLPKYEKKAKLAYFHRDYEEAHRLFDSLVNHELKGSYMDNFKFHSLKGKEVALEDFQKPMYLITYASWVVSTPGEIPAINELAKKYRDQIDFVILLWDTQKTAKKVAKSYNENITVLYVNESNNKDSYVISQLKHSLGLPTTFLLDENKEILDIKREVTHPYGISMGDSFDMNYNSISDGISTHLLDRKFNRTSDPVASN